MSSDRKASIVFLVFAVVFAGEFGWCFATGKPAADLVATALATLVLLACWRVCQ